MLERWGARISRQTMVEWIRLAAERLEPIHKVMHQGLLSSGYIQVDETPIRCNDPDLPDGKTTKGWLWALSRPQGDVVFVWRLSREYAELDTLLGNYRGILQSDGYEAYPSYAGTHEGVEWVGCWAHARRKFFEAAAERPRTARSILRLIGRLYRHEAEWDEAKVDGRRAALRQEHFARPLYWLGRITRLLRARVLPQSGLGKACDYLLNHWEPLTAHLRHSQTRLDTNTVENAIRPSALGKNYAKRPVMRSRWEPWQRSNSVECTTVAKPALHNYRASRNASSRGCPDRRRSWGAGGDSSDRRTSAFIWRSASM